MKSVKNGTDISKAEITNVSEHGFWLFYKGNEYFLPFSEFPWFRQCRLSEIFDVQSDENGNFHWPKPDIDLNIAILENPEKYPLKYQ